MKMRIKSYFKHVNGRNIFRSEFATIIEQNNQRVNETPDYYRQRQQLAEHCTVLAGH
jgi:hypothetical protein